MAASPVFAGHVHSAPTDTSVTFQGTSYNPGTTDHPLVSANVTMDGQLIQVININWMKYGVMNGFKEKNYSGDKGRFSNDTETQKEANQRGNAICGWIDGVTKDSKWPIFMSFQEFGWPMKDAVREFLQNKNFNQVSGVISESGDVDKRTEVWTKGFSSDERWMDFDLKTKMVLSSKEKGQMSHDARAAGAFSTKIGDKKIALIALHKNSMAKSEAETDNNLDCVVNAILKSGEQAFKAGADSCLVSAEWSFPFHKRLQHLLQGGAEIHLFPWVNRAGDTERVNDGLVIMRKSVLDAVKKGGVQQHPQYSAFFNGHGTLKAFSGDYTANNTIAARALGAESLDKISEEKRKEISLDLIKSIDTDTTSGPVSKSSTPKRKASALEEPLTAADIQAVQTQVDAFLGAIQIDGIKSSGAALTASSDTFKKLFESCGIKKENDFHDRKKVNEAKSAIRSIKG